MSTENFSIVCPLTYVSKVAVIKSIRTLTGLGLKDAKDASERPGLYQIFPLYRNNFFSYAIPEHEIEKHYAILRGEGVKVGPPVWKIIDELHRLAKAANEQGETTLGDEILQLVLAENLRRARHK